MESKDLAHLGIDCSNNFFKICTFLIKVEQSFQFWYSRVSPISLILSQTINYAKFGKQLSNALESDKNRQMLDRS